MHTCIYRYMFWYKSFIRYMINKYFISVCGLSFLFLFLFIYLFIYLHLVLVAAGGLLSCGMWSLSCGMHMGSSSLTRDRTWAPCIGSAVLSTVPPGKSLHFLKGAFWRAKVLNFDEVQFINIFSYRSCFLCHILQIFPNAESQYFSCMFFCMYFILIALTFRFIYHFKLIFGSGVK